MRFMALNLALAGAALFGPYAAGAAEVTKFEGVCEASAAAILGDTHFAVASDETESLTIYQRGNPAPVDQMSREDVTDIEAATRIGDVVFWLTSHSRNSSNQDRPKRKVLFATAIDAGGKLRNVGSDFRSLRPRLAAALGIAEPKLISSLNVEGLAATPGGSLLLGLRGPLTSAGEARVVRIDDPFDLVGLVQPAVPAETLSVKEVSYLNLGGRGIRSIERVGTGNHLFLIVAGPVEDGSGLPPRLFWWDGVNDVTPGPVAALDGLNPEAVIAWSETQIQILSDDGSNECSDEKPTPRAFRSIEVTF